MTALDLLFLDCDGVILESAELKRIAFGQLFSDFPEHVREIEEMHAQASGISRFRQFEMVHAQILRKPLSDEESAELSRRYSESVLAGLMTCPLVPGLEALLERVRGTVPIVVVSGSPNDELAHVLERRGLAPSFAEIVGTPKEKPAAIQAALLARRVKPRHAVMVGDAPSDWKAAEATGIHFIGRRAPGSVGFPPGTVTVDDLNEFDSAVRELGLSTSGRPNTPD